MQRYPIATIVVRSLLYVLVVVGIVTLWVAILWMRSIPLSTCPQECQNFTAIVTRDPYCVIDPVCTSPFYNPEWRQGGFEQDKIPRWQGLGVHLLGG